MKHTSEVISLIRSSICEFRLVDCMSRYKQWCVKYQNKSYELAKEHTYESNDYLEMALRTISDKFSSSTDELTFIYKRLEKLDYNNDKLKIIKQLYMPGCYARTLEDIVWADHDSFTKQHDNNSELTSKLIEKLKSNEYIKYGGNEMAEVNKLYNLIRFRHYKQVLEGIEDLIVLIHDCVNIMDSRGLIHDWRLSCKEVMSKNEMEIGELNKIYDKKEPITSVMHVVYALSNYLIFDRYSELVSQVYKEISVRLLLKISKHV